MSEHTPIPVHVWRARVAHLAETDSELRKRLPVVLDMMADARGDGTHALRTVKQTAALMSAAGLPMTDRTVERHRAWAVGNGYAVVQERGGRISAGTIYTATLPEHPTLPPVNVSGDDHTTTPGVNVSGDDPEHPTSTRQAHDTAERAADGRRTPVVPASSKPEPRDLADQLAAATNWPVDHCRKALADKRADLIARGYDKAPDALLRRIITENPTELPAPTASARPKITLAQCETYDEHAKHEWADKRNRFHCMGVDR
jgi:hypothetical protein